MAQPRASAIGRRGALTLGAGALAAGTRRARAAGADIAGQWAVFRSRFLQPDGRIVDTGNGGISHSEGQGWGMLFSEAANDRDSFELIFAWTHTHLTRPQDALHVWRYDPNAAHPTVDPNNATDGDIFITWALSRAAARWSQPALSAAAANIAADILAKLCVQQSGRYFLLPGVSGFATPKSLTLNPSYYVLPAFQSLALLAPSPSWDALREDGLSTLRNGVFGQWDLPPDWLSVSRPELNLALAAGWPPRFSFDAIRVPLWLSWAAAMPAEMGADFARFWQSPGFAYRPAWVNLQDGSIAPFAAASGMQAVANLTLAALNGTAPQLPGVAEAQDYYSASLTLLAHLAASELALVPG